MKYVKTVAAAAMAALALAGCGSSSPSLTWTCTVATGGTGTGAWDFTATVTASNPGTAPVDVGGYALVIYDASGAEIFSTDHVPWSVIIEPGKSDSSSYERGSILDQAPATCEVPQWSAGS